jgi:phytoene synthase
VRAFGDASPAADKVAYALGRALQLTNILRDIDEDAARNRLYLPREYLLDAAIPLNPAAASAAPQLPDVCKLVAKVARARFAEARAAMRACNRRAMRPARLMAANYDAILAMLEKRGWQDRTRRVRLSKWQKIWILLTC